MSIIHHVEKYLGKIDAGWKPDESSQGISVSRFCNQPVEGLSTYVTLGLSHHKLLMPNGKEVKQELIFSTYENAPGKEIARLLLRIADLIISEKEAILRGDIIGPGKQILSCSSMNAIYVSLPVIFDEDFSTYKETLPPTILAWLVPVFSDEAIYIKEYGWEEFENILEHKDPDLWDLGRNSVIG